MIRVFDRPRKAALVGESAVTLAAVRVALAVLPFETVCRWARRVSRIQRHRLLSDYEVARAVESVSIHFGGLRNCLVRALSAQLMLSRRGRKAELCIGVSHERSTFLAHAWLVCDGNIVVGGTPRDIGAFTRLRLRCVGGP